MYSWSQRAAKSLINCSWKGNVCKKYLLHNSWICTADLWEVGGGYKPAILMAVGFPRELFCLQFKPFSDTSFFSGAWFSGKLCATNVAIYLNRPGAFIYRNCPRCSKSLKKLLWCERLLVELSFNPCFCFVTAGAGLWKGTTDSPSCGEQPGRAVSLETALQHEGGEHHSCVLAASVPTGRHRCMFLCTWGGFLFPRTIRVISHSFSSTTEL